MQRYCTFVVRIAVDNEPESELGGQVSFVGTQETVYFREMDKLMEFIQSQVKKEEADRSTGEKNGHTIHPEARPRDRT